MLGAAPQLTCTRCLQRLAEDLQYRHLLEAACEAAPGPERMRHIVAFALCSYGGTLQRIAKPFNPLLGETYEWRSADGSCRFLAEQVLCQLLLLCLASAGCAAVCGLQGSC